MIITTVSKQWKRILFSFLILANSFSLLAQSGISFGDQIVAKPSTYIGFGMGMNSSTGFLGVNVELPLADEYSLIGSAGLGGWGFKIGGGFSYYTKGEPFGLGLGLEYNYATGSGSGSVELENAGVNGEPIKVVYKPTSTISPILSYGWKIGKKFNRFILSTGYSIRIGAKAYTTAESNDVLSATTIDVLNILQPGGFVLGLKLMFGTR